MNKAQNCLCDICKNNLPFEMPDEVIEAIEKEQLILFAGAGISTESKKIFKETLYEDIYEDLDNKKNIGLSFPALMSEYCRNMKNGRQKLLEKIKFRFEYCHQFNELYREASGFHRTVSQFWMIKNIITTNWDDYFERECNAIPIVSAEDFAFYNINQRKIFKIHGSIGNYGSIVATEEDYRACYKKLNTGLVGANLKTMIATKTLLFAGYSFRDFDFIKVLKYLKKEMGSTLPHLYILTLDDSYNNSLKGFNYTIIKTDATFFFDTIKKHFNIKNTIIPAQFVNQIFDIEILRAKAHRFVSNMYKNNKLTSLIYCLFYQDGIQHAIDYLKFNLNSGESYNEIQIRRQIYSYESLKPKYIKSKNYSDLAYVEGYIQGLKIPISFGDPKAFPLYFLFGKGYMCNKDEFATLVNSKKIFHKDSDKHGQQFYKKYFDKDIIMHHRPFIF